MFDLLNFGALLPVIALVVGGAAILLLELFSKPSRALLVALTEISLIAASLVLIYGNFDEAGFFNMVLVDGLSLASLGIILCASIFFIPLALTGMRFIEYQFAELYALFLFMVAGFAVMVSSNNLIVILLALETASLALYTLISMHRRDKSLEAAIKYYTMGGMAAAMIAFGTMLLYAATGSVDIAEIKLALAASDFANLPLTLAASAFIIAGLGFKLSVVPFHTWTPDVYEGSSAPMAGYMSIVPKIAGFAVAIRLFDFLAQSPDRVVYWMLFAAAVATMTLGNLLALVQVGVKRMLAYSSVSHAGFVMSVLVIGTTDAHIGLFLYWTLFLFTNLGAFVMLWISRHPSKVWDIRYDHPYTKFAGMARLSPMGAIIMAIFMLSLAGIPPFALFFGKVFLISEAIKSDHLALAIIMLVNSAIAIYYYLKLIIYMFLHDPADNDGTIYYQNGTTAIKAVLGVAAAAVTIAVFWIDPLMRMLTPLLTSSGY
ncbi:MAG: NADH-quinone oxidoreductase subunit NuoN [Helicobacteraceae bacterium]|jgi:NADH-quinone oxidoreductase subunit N|nr:NADH-quinone oxidoreductase subunit NuoN [Helicobacteraceae bacterium]